MSMSDPPLSFKINLVSFRAIEAPYSPNQYLDRDFFATSYSKAALVTWQIQKGFHNFLHNFSMALYHNYWSRWCVYLCSAWSINNEAAMTGFQQNWPNQRYFQHFYKQQRTESTIDLVFFAGNSLAATSLRDHMVNFKNWNLEAIFC